jgi:D-alanine-D-alanine ligase
MKKLTIALLSGGISPEREVSRAGGDMIYQALDREKYHVIRYDPKTDLGRLVKDASGIDAALINLHGAFGEDGTVQGLLDLLGIPYQGSGVLGSAVAMNKLLSKQLYERIGLPIPPHLYLKCGDPLDFDRCMGRIGLPLVVKPVSCGSSIGMSLVRSAADLKPAVEIAFREDKAILIEKYIEGIELTCAVLGNENLTALPVIEIIPDRKHPFFNYQAKYTAGEANEICPARIDGAMTEKAQEYAKTAHSALCCLGYSRTDMILDGAEIYVLETNTIPGMTPTSLLPRAAATAGISFGELLDRLIALGIEAHEKIKRTRSAKITHNSERPGGIQEAS